MVGSLLVTGALLGLAHLDVLLHALADPAGRLYRLPDDEAVHPAVAFRSGAGSCHGSSRGVVCRVPFARRIVHPCAALAIYTLLGGGIRHHLRDAG